MRLRQLGLKVRMRMYHPILKEMSEDILIRLLKRAKGKLNVVNKRAAPKYRMLVRVFEEELRRRELYKISL